MPIKIDAEDFQPLIEQCVRRAVEEMDSRNGRLSYGEAEAASLIGVSKAALRNARYRGEVKATRLGKNWLYRRTDLLEFLDQQEMSDRERRTPKK